MPLVGICLMQIHKIDVEVPEKVQLLANQRWEAKSNKDWAESDRLRDEINSHGWIIKDDKEGFKLEPEKN